MNREVGVFFSILMNTSEKYGLLCSKPHRFISHRNTEELGLVYFNTPNFNTPKSLWVPSEPVAVAEARSRDVRRPQAR